jgi:hypothetical protein
MTDIQLYIARASISLHLLVVKPSVRPAQFIALLIYTMHCRFIPSFLCNVWICHYLWCRAGAVVGARHVIFHSMAPIPTDSHSLTKPLFVYYEVSNKRRLSFRNTYIADLGISDGNRNEELDSSGRFVWKSGFESCC